MKKMLTGLFSLAILATSISLNAQDEKQEKYQFMKQKDINKSYPSASKLDIENSFGTVKFITWDKTEVKVDVHIEVSSNKEALAQEIFESIDVSDKLDGGTAKFKTSMKNRKNNDNYKDCKSNMKINYEVHLPATLALDVENSFGSIDLPDYTGTASIQQKFGHLTTGSLTSVKELSVEFGEANIKSLSQVDANFKFSKITIDNLSGKNKLKFEFCDKSRISYDNNLSSLSITESYSTINLHPVGTVSANYNINTSFGSVIDRGSANIKRTDTPDKYGPDSDRTYTGQTGSGGANIDVKSSFGKIIVGEPTAEDMADKDKNKNKNKKVKEI